PKSLSAEACELLKSHGWPGNVRELENVLRAVALFGADEMLSVQDFVDYSELFRTQKRPALRAVVSEPQRATSSAWERLDAEKLSLKDLKTRIEIECITEALTRSGGNITRAAALLGMKRPRLSQLIKEHGIALTSDVHGGLQ